jgi:hypothetical protein
MKNRRGQACHAERATMVTVLAMGNLLAAIVAGGVMGRLLVRT